MRRAVKESAILPVKSDRLISFSTDAELGIRAVAQQSCTQCSHALLRVTSSGRRTVNLLCSAKHFFSKESTKKRHN